MALHLIGLSLHEENRALGNNELSSQFLTKAKEMDWIPKDQGMSRKVPVRVCFLVPLSANLRFRLASTFAFSVVVVVVPPPMKLYVPAFRIFSNLVCEFAMILIA